MIAHECETRITRSSRRDSRWNAERARAAEAEYRRALDDYRTLMLHRLMNPLTAIRGCAETLRAGPDMSDRQRDELLATIVEMTNRLELMSVDPYPLNDVERASVRAVPDLRRREGSWILKTG